MRCGVEWIVLPTISELMTDENELPLANKMAILTLFGVSILLWISCLAVGFSAAFGIPFLYGGLVIDWLPYEHDGPLSLLLLPFTAILRLLIASIPSIAVVMISDIGVTYLTEGKDRARESLGIMCKEFLKGLMSPSLFPRRKGGDSK